MESQRTRRAEKSCILSKQELVILKFSIAERILVGCIDTHHRRWNSREKEVVVRLQLVDTDTPWSLDGWLGELDRISSKIRARPHNTELLFSSSTTVLRSFSTFQIINSSKHKRYPFPFLFTIHPTS